MAQDKLTLMREMVLLTLLDKAEEQIKYILSDNMDSRFNNLLTQLYALRLDLEDKIREDNVDDNIPIGQPPTLGKTGMSNTIPNIPSPPPAPPVVPPVTQGVPTGATPIPTVPKWTIKR